MFLKTFQKRRKKVVGRGNSRVLVYSSLFLLCALLVSLPSRADTQQVEGLDLKRILVMGDVEVEISQGDTAEFMVRGSRSDLKKQPFFQDGDTLVLGRNQSNDHKFGRLLFKLTVVDIDHIQLNGSSEVYVKPLIVEDLYVSVDGSGEIKLFGVRGRDLTFKVSGSADVQVVALTGLKVKMLVSGSGDLQIGELNAESIDVSLSGSGDFAVDKAGKVSEMEINIVGSGDVDLKKVEAQRVSVNIVGSGEVIVSALDELDANIMGSANVFYIGSPEVSQSILGSGEVQCQ